MALVRGGKSLFNSAVLSNNVELNVVDSVETTVDTFTASGRDESITRLLCSGQGNGVWNIYVDTDLRWTFNTANGDRTKDMKFFSPFLLADGSTIDIKVTHFHVGDLLTFNSTIEGIV